ncbi:unnamed protein product, partial [Discosporangium mesarthrocarpum]
EVNDLVFRAGAGDITFNADIGTAAADSRPGTFTVEDSTASLTFGGADAAATDSDTAPVSTINLDGAMNLGAAATELTSIVFNGGPGVGDTLAIDTTGDDVRINGPVTLNSSVEITTDAAAAGDITFTNDSPIDAQAAESNNLTLTAGTGSVFFNEDIGSTNNIGALTITRADGGVVFGQADTETPGDGTTGPVNTVSTDDAIDIGSTNVIAGGIVLNGGTGTIAFQTTDDNVRLNGAVTLQSSTTIDTGDNGGDITFTSDSTIDSGDGTSAAPLATTLERNNLFLD